MSASAPGPASPARTTSQSRVAAAGAFLSRKRALASASRRSLRLVAVGVSAARAQSEVPGPPSERPSARASAAMWSRAFTLLGFAAGRGDLGPLFVGLAGGRLAVVHLELDERALGDIDEHRVALFAADDADADNTTIADTK